MRKWARTQALTDATKERAAAIAGRPIVRTEKSGTTARKGKTT